MPLAPQGGPRPRLHHRRPARRRASRSTARTARPLPASPPLPEPDGRIGEAHDADITPDTIIPPWYGERLDLDHAIWACFANARTDEEKQADWEQAQEPAFRPDTRGGDFSDTADYIRRYYEEHPAA